MAVSRQSKKSIVVFGVVLLGALLLDSISVTLPNFDNHDGIRVFSANKQNQMDVYLVPQEPDSLSLEMMQRANIALSPPATVSMNSCPLTAQVRLRIPPPQQHGNNTWIMESLDVQGNHKTMGGDEYYVTYTDDASTEMGPTAVAFVRDVHDGTYQLRFVTTPSFQSTNTTLSKTGTLNIVLQYSCGIGHLAPPAKANWKTGGAINAKYTLFNMTAPTAMEPFVPPSSFSNDMNLGQYDCIVCYGDSTMGNLVTAGKERGNLVWPAGNVGAPLNTDTIQNPRPQHHKTSPSMLDEVKMHVNNALNEHTNVALLIGSGVWDIIGDSEARQGPSFADHQKALRQLLTSIQQEFPNLPIYWKSHTAMHIHRVADKKDWYHLGRVFYMSSSRSYDLYRFQRGIVRDLNISMLDLYPATYLSAHELEQHDGRHYSQAFNKKMLSWFYQD